MTDDLSIPAFLRATGPGAPCTFERTSCSDDPNTRPPGYGPSCWEEMHRPEQLEQRELAEALKRYEDEKRFAAFQQYCIEHPELVAMNRKAKRDAERRIARMGIPPANRRRAR